jgi:hypothetical protein
MGRVERNPLRSARWFGANDLAGFIHRASLHAEGISRAALEGRPVIGICNAWSELVNCNLHFRGLAEAAKRGVMQAGGLPLEFPTISLGENLMKPSAMLFRNLMAMDVEECIRSYPLDAGNFLESACNENFAIDAGHPANSDFLHLQRILSFIHCGLYHHVPYPCAPESIPNALCALMNPSGRAISRTHQRMRVRSG